MFRADVRQYASNMRWMYGRGRRPRPARVVRVRHKWAWAKSVFDSDSQKIQLCCAEHPTVIVYYSATQTQCLRHKEYNLRISPSMGKVERDGNDERTSRCANTSILSRKGSTNHTAPRPVVHTLRCTHQPAHQTPAERGLRQINCSRDVHLSPASSGSAKSHLMVSAPSNAL